MITLKTLPEATAQEVYDQVARHLLTQKKRSKHDHSCAYRGDGGLMCAAGCLIAEDEYDAEMEGLSWSGLLGKDFAPAAHEDLVVDLQGVHDGREVDHWEMFLRQVADNHELSPAVLEEFK